MSGRCLIGWVAGCVLLVAATPAFANEPPCDFCTAPCDTACWIDGGESPGDGKPGSWSVPVIPYKVNLGRLLTVQTWLNEKDVLAAIKAAMDTYAAVSCSDLKFSYAGKTTETALVKDHLLVHFSCAFDAAYRLEMFTSGELHQTPIGQHNRIRGGRVLLGCKRGLEYSLDWTTQGAQQNKIDIQTMITYALPRAIGFEVGPHDRWPVHYNAVKRDLCPTHQNMIRFLYFSPSSGNQCSAPRACSCASPSTCIDPPTKPYPIDSGTPGGQDGGGGGGGGKQDSGTTGKQDAGGHYNDAGVWVAADGGGTSGGGGGGDGGCDCRVGGRGASTAPFWALFGIGFLLLLGRRRRR